MAGFGDRLLRLAPMATGVTDLSVASASVSVRAELTYASPDDAQHDVDRLQQLSIEELSSMLVETVTSLSVSLAAAPDSWQADTNLIVGGAILAVGLVCTIVVTCFICLRCSVRAHPTKPSPSNVERVLATANKVAAASTPVPRPVLRRAYSSLDDQEFAARYAHQGGSTCTLSRDGESALPHRNRHRDSSTPRTAERTVQALQGAPDASSRAQAATTVYA